MERSARRTAVAAVMAAALALAATPEATAAPRPGGGGSPTCSRKNPCDTTVPSVAISSPAAGATVSGTVAVTGTAADNAGVAVVEVQVDGGSWAPASGTASWAWSLVTTTLAAGSHTVTARATDAAGNRATTTIAIVVGNPATDTVPPTVDITAPEAGATVSGTVAVTGSAADDTGVAQVEVRVDDGGWARAEGSGAWSWTVDVTGLAEGDHVVAARATDAAGNVATTSRSVRVAHPATTGSDLVLADPRARYELLPLGRTRLPQWATLTGVLYTEQFTNRRAVAFRDAATGQVAYVDLPSDSLAGWANAATFMTSASELWVFGGSGPLVARRFRLSGSPVPATAELVESRTFGDVDSREGDAIVLQSGAVVLAWGQQGETGPQGLHVAYRSPGGLWQHLPALTFMPSFASDQVLGQHPADGSVWLFNSPDAWGRIGAARFTETTTGLRVDWTDWQFISDTEYGLDGPDPENPNLAVAADASTGSLALAYQSADRRNFTNASTTRIGSRITIARIPGAGAPSFLRLPVWAERVSAVGLAVGGGDTVVSYRPVDEATLSFDQVHVSRHRGGTWEPAEVFGTMVSTDRVAYATGTAEFSTKLSDGRIHLRAF